MRAILVKESTTDLYIGEVVTPTPNSNELLVSVKATALNRADLLQKRGLYPPPPGASPILGLEMAGEVVAIGSQVTGWQVGDRVCALLSGGGYAEYVTIPAAMAMPIPDLLSFNEAAAIPEAFLTAYLCLKRLAHLQSDQTVLIHAGASGVGTAAIQLVREMGGYSYITVGSEAKREFGLSLGAQLAINYHKEDFALKIKEVTEGRGVDLILDSVGANYWQQNIQSLAMDGKMVIIATMSGNRVPEVNLTDILRRRLQIIGSTLRGRTNDYKISLTRDFAEFALPRFSSRRLVPVVDKIWTWEEVEAAHRYMEENHNIGKIILTIS